MKDEDSIELLRLLATRLEHLSVDSSWARRASGLRGNIVKILEESDMKEIATERLKLLIDRSFEILREAAHEIPDIDDLLQKHNQA
jgi:hypothetical protein